MYRAPDDYPGIGQHLKVTHHRRHGPNIEDVADLDLMVWAGEGHVYVHLANDGPRDDYDYLSIDLGHLLTAIGANLAAHNR
jgi:hypothetical protein